MKLYIDNPNIGYIRSRNLSSLLSRIFLFLYLFAFTTSTVKSQCMEWLYRPGEYDKSEYAGNNLFRVKTSQGKWGLLDSDGKQRISAVYDSITPFIENRALLLDRASNRLLGIIDSNGELIKGFSSDYFYVSKFPQYKEGRLAYTTGDGFYGYLNEKGGVSIEPRFYLAAPFQDGVAAVQYDNTEYGLIRKDGRSAIVSDDRFYFMSSPVDGKVLAIRGSRKGGDQLVLMRIDGISLKKDKVLEDGMNISLSDDFTSLECQLGHSYYLDDQWRINSASYPAPLPQVWKEPSGLIPEDTSVLRGIETPDGIKISYLDIPIANTQLQEISTYDKNFAIVKTKDGKSGVLKLNALAEINIIPTSEPVIFQHNEKKDVALDVSLKNLDPSKIIIKDRHSDSSPEYTLEQMDGEWKLHIPYFKPSDKYDEATSEKLDLIIEYDGLEWKNDYAEITSKHQPGYTANLTGSETTDENGKAVLNLHVKAIDGNNAQGDITINGGKPISFSKGGKTVPLNVSLPEGSNKVFSYSVKVQEEGCPDYSVTVSKNVSNPIKKPSEKKDNSNKKPLEKKDNSKKKIIIQ